MRFLQTVLCLFLALLLLPSCDESSKQQGLYWQAPAYQSMPPAFTPSEEVPDYARHWRAPQSFQGFVQSWNEAAGDDAAHEAIRLATLADLPSELCWQDGLDQPEIGSDQAMKGGAMRLAIQRSFPNTMRALGAGSNNATRHYFYDDLSMPLVRQHPQTGKLIGGVAKRWAISADNKKVYFELDGAARFSNGQPVRTQDYITAVFLYSSPFASDPFYLGYYQKNIRQITIYSDHIMAVELKNARPFTALYANIPLCCTSFYAEFGPDFITRYQWRIPPTTGGYTPDPDGIILGRQIRLKRVRDWWAAQRKFTQFSCNVDSITFSFIQEITKIRELFRVAEIDAFNTREMDDWYDNLEIPELHRGYIQRVHFNNICPRNSFGIHLNCSQAPLDDINVRLGLQHACNIQAVIAQIFRGDFPRNKSYFSGFGEFTNEQLIAREFDPSLARDYFAKAGYTILGDDGILRKEDGTRLSITVQSRIDPLYSNAMNWLSMDAARCGVELKHVSADDTIFFTQVLNKKPQASIFSWSFSPPLPEPSSYFLSQFAYDANGQVVTQTNNITATSNAELDQAIAATITAQDEQSARLAHHRVQELIHEEAMWVPAWTSTFWRFAQWRWVRWPYSDTTQFCPPRYYDPLDSHLYWIDSEEKKRVKEAQHQGIDLGEQEIIITLPQA